MGRVVVIGGGGAGIMAAIVAAKSGYEVRLIEKLSLLGAKLKATGGGKCNLTNRLDREAFIERFGRNGRFMQEALKAFSNSDLVNFFASIGVETHSPDGYRVFPTTHNSMSILKALEDEVRRLGVNVHLKEYVTKIVVQEDRPIAVVTNQQTIAANRVILATGGLGYPMLGTTGDGYSLASSLGHKITPLFPAMLPLQTKESWVASCRADTIAKVTIKIDIKKYTKLRAVGDLIFTKQGIRGPVVLDFARELTPLIQKYKEVPLLLNFTKGMNEEEIRAYLKKHAKTYESMVALVGSLLPQALAVEILKLANIDLAVAYGRLSGVERDCLIRLLAWTPLRVIGSEGFDKAMITRGGVSLKEINPYTMQSKKIKGLYFCGEVVDIDGPCGGYNLQWSFSSGYLAGKLLES
jgi:predicted Rossmann fold flavoprotein